MSHPFETDDHRAFRQTLSAFVDRELMPQAAAWDEAGAFPAELYAKAGQVGLLGIGFPEEFGGTPGDPWTTILVAEQLARPGVGGLAAGLMSHAIALPPIAALGSPELKARVLPRVISGERIAALAVTEPGGGSDVAHLKTTAQKDGDHYVLNGEKCFITSGMRADVLTVAVRTGDDGAGGVSILVVEGQPEGLTRTEMKKMGWWASDTAALHFDDVRVPASNMVGPENMGFMGLMLNFNNERLMLAATAWAFGKVAFGEALAWAQERHTFGKPLIQRQVIRHKLVDMKASLDATKALLDVLAWRLNEGEQPVSEICSAKNTAVDCAEFCAKEAVQILGGAGYGRGTKSERIYREVKVMAIGGGATEILKDLAARQAGW